MEGISHWKVMDLQFPKITDSEKETMDNKAIKWQVIGK